jgi:hypothetical protein
MGTRESNRGQATVVKQPWSSNRGQATVVKQPWFSRGSNGSQSRRGTTCGGPSQTMDSKKKKKEYTYHIVDFGDLLIFLLIRWCIKRTATWLQLKSLAVSCTLHSTVRSRVVYTCTVLVSARHSQTREKINRQNRGAGPGPDIRAFPSTRSY